MSERPQNKNLKPFKPGQSGNPSGRPKLPDDILEARQAKTEDFIRIALTCLTMKSSELNKLIVSKNSTAMEKLVGKILYSAIFHSDYLRANFILDRALGKVPETVNNNVSMDKSLHLQVLEAIEKSRASE